MINTSKYTRQFFPVKNPTRRWVEKNYIEKAPTWCSVDLRDGNQSLIIPMSLDEKLDFFKLLVKLGFKEIEVGFPAASETEYTFLRTLIENDLIPDDVTVQVLTQSREHIIRKTFEALRGCKNAIVHLYNSTSLIQREQVFRKSKEEIVKIATDGAELFNRIASDTRTDYRFEYSPESFTGTEPEFALEICNAVLDVWKPTPERKAIINLPVTVELSSPHVYADQVEYMCDHLKYRDSVVVSLHPHNDRGCAVADSELGILAGAERIEGTLFGNGERTGNVDIITLALNLYMQGVEPNLDFTNMPEIAELYERVTRMKVYERQPYAGKLVFAAFSGSHQDAIAKGMKWREEKKCAAWTVPYLPIDPEDVGRKYEADVIRINSQSGKGGIGYLLEKNFGYILPAKMREEVGYTVKSVSDRLHSELSANEVLDVFKRTYLNAGGYFSLKNCRFESSPENSAVLTVEVEGKIHQVHGYGCSCLDAVCDAMRKRFKLDFSVLLCEKQPHTKESEKSPVYICIAMKDGRNYWGAGIETDEAGAQENALFSALNRGLKGGT